MMEVESHYERHLVAILMTEPVYRRAPTNRTKLIFEQLNPKSPEAIKDWFYPGESKGQQFIYAGHAAMEHAPAHANEQRLP